MEPINVFISGVAGCGKTTTINEYIEKMNQFTGIEASLVGRRIRGIIKEMGINPPSMVKDSGDVDTFRNIDFLVRLTDWQSILLDLHRSNMERPENTPEQGGLTLEEALTKSTIHVHDRCALDSAAYFLYDLYTWNAPHSYKKIVEAYEEDDSGKEVSDEEREKIEAITDRPRRRALEDLIDIILAYVVEYKRRSQSASIYFESLVTGIRSLLSVGADFSKEELDVIAYQSRRIAYILSQYFLLLYTIPGIYVVLTQNVHVKAEEDGVRLTDSQMNRIIEDIYEQITDRMVHYSTYSPEELQASFATMNEAAKVINSQLGLSFKENRMIPKVVAPERGDQKFLKGALAQYEMMKQAIYMENKEGGVRDLYVENDKHRRLESLVTITLLHENVALASEDLLDEE